MTFAGPSVAFQFGEDTTIRRTRSFHAAERAFHNYYIALHRLLTLKMEGELGPFARTLSLPYYEDALPAHDSTHANRVRDLTVRLANECSELVDRGVLVAAARFHDVGRPLERSGEIEEHGEWAAELLETGAVSTDRIDAVRHCVRTHSIRSSSPEPESTEARPLFDADKLEAAGARSRSVVLYRRRAGEKYAVIDDSPAAGVPQTDRPDIALLRDWAEERLDRLYTASGRRPGASRSSFMDDFFGRFDGEMGVEGEH